MPPEVKLMHYLGAVHPLSKVRESDYMINLMAILFDSV
jgi:hypothetical protein